LRELSQATVADLKVEPHPGFAGPPNVVGKGEVI
jgi:hypothetical protein